MFAYFAAWATTVVVTVVAIADGQPQSVTARVETALTGCRVEYDDDDAAMMMMMDAVNNEQAVDEAALEHARQLRDAQAFAMSWWGRRAFRNAGG